MGKKGRGGRIALLNLITMDGRKRGKEGDREEEEEEDADRAHTHFSVQPLPVTASSRILHRCQVSFFFLGLQRRPKMRLRENIGFFSLLIKHFTGIVKL